MAGRPPKEKSFANMLRIAISEASSEGKTKLRDVAEKLVQLALAGDMQAIKEVADRLDGKPPQFSTDNADEFRRALDMSDDELAAIAAGGSEPAPEAADHPQITH